MDTQTNFFIRFIVIIFFFLIPNQVFSSCDDSLDDGVDYSNCQFSDGQDLAGSFLPNSIRTLEPGLSRPLFLGIS